VTRPLPFAHKPLTTVVQNESAQTHLSHGTFADPLLKLLGSI